MDPYEITYPVSNKVPVLISIPHCGTEFPEEIRPYYKPEMIADPDDTDWYVDKLYDFAAEMGITVIKSRYHRWVIDLNRDPSNEPLYSDGRLITGLTPTTTFSGTEIYRYDPPDEDEVERRLSLYYNPYHAKLKELLDGLKTEFGKVLLFDAHSIKQRVLSIHPQDLPDLVLGNNRRIAAGEELIKAAVKILSASDYSFAHNFLFKGGYITRHYGNPREGVHALQLEMTQVNYMDQWEVNYNEENAGVMKNLLRNLFTELIKILED